MVRKVLSAVALASVVAATPAMAQTAGSPVPAPLRKAQWLSSKRFPMTLT